MLDTLRPKQVDPKSTQAKVVRKRELEIHISHVQRPEESLMITVSKGDIAVSFGYDHMHFFPAKDPDWMDDALHFVRDILRGRVELQVTFKGRMPVKTSLFRTDEERPLPSC